MAWHGMAYYTITITIAITIALLCNALPCRTVPYNAPLYNRRRLLITQERIGAERVSMGTKEMRAACVPNVSIKDIRMYSMDFVPS